MRLDHIAYRVKDRLQTAKFFINALGYHIQQEFTIDFGDGQTAQCIALEPPEKKAGTSVLWTYGGVNYMPEEPAGLVREVMQTYHLPPEIFISDGSPGSIVGNWVAARGDVGGVHHMAYQVKSVEETMKEWLDKGYAEFTSDKPMECDGGKLKQVFTKPSVLTGVIFEFIERGERGFCNQNVKALMESTKDMESHQKGHVVL
jgi:catechol 2,3-dioxygenase-like lactoylglutathione lyase family enzyme